MWLAKKWPERVIKWPFLSRKFLQNCKGNEFFLCFMGQPFYVVAFDPIKIQTCQTLQNDRLNSIFVKDIRVVCKKMTKNGPKRLILKCGSIFNASDFIYIIASASNLYQSFSNISKHGLRTPNKVFFIEIQTFGLWQTN